MAVEGEVRALHGAVPGDIGGNQRGDAQGLEPCTKGVTGILALLRPAVNGHVAVLQVDPHGDFVSVGLHRFLKKSRLRHRGGAQDHPAHAALEIRFDDLHGADAAAHLGLEGGRSEDFLDGWEIGGGAGLGALQVHQMDPSGAAGGKVPRYFAGIVVIDGLLGIVALVEPDGFAAVEVNGRKNQHLIPPPQRRGAC